MNNHALITIVILVLSYGIQSHPILDTLNTIRHSINIFKD